MTDRNRIIVVGAGHNGLAAAAYLARAGRDVLVLEAGDAVGGAAITREFAPGFRVPACAHLLYMLDAEIERELKLAAHGLELVRRDLKTVALSDEGEPLVLAGGRIETGSVSSNDASAFPAFHERLLRFARVIAKQHNRLPPRLGGGGRSEAIAAGKLALDIRRLGRTDLREFLRVAGINIFDVLEETFDSPQLKGAIALDAVLGTNLGPRSNNSVLTLLHRLSGQLARGAAGPALARGGMGAVTDALAAAAKAAGATIRTSAPVARIVLEGDRVSGVELGDGEMLPAATVVSNADPVATLLGLVGARHLETGFVHRIHHLRRRGTAAKLHLALENLPAFDRVSAQQIGERLLIAPDPVYVDRAFDASKYGECSAAPVLEITLPSVHDTTLAPGGKHVMSAIVQYAPFDPRASTGAARNDFLETVIGTLERHAPSIRQQIIASELLLPADIERDFRITGGHWHHGELALEQFMMLRPVPFAAQYAMPVNGLYLCGAGCHPGGGVMGSAGRNAARAVLSRGRSA